MVGFISRYHHHFGNKKFLVGFSFVFKKGLKFYDCFKAGKGEKPFSVMEFNFANAKCDPKETIKIPGADFIPELKLELRRNFSS